jgi:hypothetical protein
LEGAGIVMQIPINPPDLHLGQATQRERQAVIPVTAVPSVPEIAETLAPHVALQWAQPVFSDQGADPTRTKVQTEVSSDPGSSSPGRVGIAAKNPPATLMQWSEPGLILTQLLKQTQTSAAFNEPSPWPEAPPAAEFTDPAQTEPPNQAVAHAFQRLFTALASSDVFAARQLASHWYGAQRAPGETQDTASASRWAQALSPEHPAAQQATHMLMTGEMVWQGEMLPGLFARVHRQDSWRENAPGSGRLEKGASLSLDIDLPRVGRVKVIGHQWGDQLDVTIRAPRQEQAGLKNAYPALEQRLAGLAPGRLTTHWQETE